MKVLAVGALFLVAVQARVMIPPHMLPLSDEMINFINNLNTTWKAGRNFEQKSKKECPKYLGTALNEKENERLPLYRPKSSPRPLPETFDARKHWSECRSISVIGSQFNCGSCWAFGVTGVISDRICIHTNGHLQVNISAMDLLTCCNYCFEKSDGCQGGKPRLAWKYYKEEGIVTGGMYVPPTQYSKEYGCKPYSIKPAFLGTPHSKYPPAPPCSRTCMKKYHTEYYKDKHYASKIYRLPKNEEDIRRDIYENGPVEARLDLYSDFYAYKSGIYKRHSNKLCDGHVVRLIGWGTQNGVKYWLAANSWGVHSGEHGYFRILRGNNECNIEDDVNAGIPKEASHAE